MIFLAIVAALAELDDSAGEDGGGDQDLLDLRYFPLTSHD
jgi:hypothetical protein